MRVIFLEATTWGRYLLRRLSLLWQAQKYSDADADDIELLHPLSKRKVFHS
jgi:hypothetical protein